MCGWTRIVHLNRWRKFTFHEDYVWYGLWATLILNTVICPGRLPYVAFRKICCYKLRGAQNLKNIMGINFHKLWKFPPVKLLSGRIRGCIYRLLIHMWIVITYAWQYWLLLFHNIININCNTTFFQSQGIFWFLSYAFISN